MLCGQPHPWEAMRWLSCTMLTLCVLLANGLNIELHSLPSPVMVHVERHRICKYLLLIIISWAAGLLDRGVDAELTSLLLRLLAFRKTTWLGNREVFLTPLGCTWM